MQKKSSVKLVPKVIKNEIKSPKREEPEPKSPKVNNQSPKLFNCEKIVKKEEVPVKTSSKKIFKIEKFNKRHPSR